MTTNGTAFDDAPAGSLPASSLAGPTLSVSARNPATVRAERRALAFLLAAGSGIILVALAYLAVAYLPWHTWRPKFHLNDLGSWQVVGASFSLGTLLAFGCYLAAWRLAARMRPTPARVALVGAVAVLAALILLPTYPLLSDDVFYSIFGGRILAYYHQNPFLVPPASFTDDAFLPFTGWRQMTMPYGPCWALLSGGVAFLVDALGADSLQAYLLGFKVVSIVAHLLATGLIGLILWRHWPERLLAGLVLWSWNPLFLIESAGNAHNGIVMVALILLGIACALERRTVMALLAVTLAVALKYVAVLLIPLLALYLVRDEPRWGAKLRALLPAGLVSVTALVALFAPFWVGWRTLGFVAESRYYYGSPAALVRLLLRSWSLPPTTQDWVIRGGGLLVCVLVYPWLLREAGKGAPQFLRACYSALLLPLLIWPFFMPWYILWAAAPAALLAVGAAPRQTVIFSAAATVTYLCQYSLRRATSHPVEVWSAAAALIAFAPLLLALLWSGAHGATWWVRRASPRPPTLTVATEALASEGD